MMKNEQLMNDERIVAMFKALSNETRLKILEMLEGPEKNFPPQAHFCKGGDFPGGCVGDIRDKIGLV